MKYYLAGPCDSEHRSLMHAVKHTIEKLMREEDSLYCPFEFKVPNAWDYPQEIWAQKVYDNDLTHILEADALIIISLGRNSTAGTNFEQGYARALQKRIYVIQIDNSQSTSLMTFCGCSYFFNTNAENIESPIYCIMRDIVRHPNEWMRTKCNTVLT